MAAIGRVSLGSCRHDRWPEPRIGRAQTLRRLVGVKTLSVHAAILSSLIRRAGRTLVVDDRRSYRGYEILAGAMHLAGRLQGVNGTDTLGLLLPTSGAYPIALLAGWILGKTVVPLNYLLKREELAYVIDHCGTDTILTAQPMLDYLGYTPDGANVIRMEDTDFSGVPPFNWPATKEDDDLAVLLYTSGTTGKPKGVMLSHGNLKANIRQIEEWVEFTTDDVMMGVLPQFHTFGLTVLTLLPLAVGMKTIYSARFVPQKIVKLIREHKPTVLVAIPSMYNALLATKDSTAEDLASLKYTVSGGEPLPESVFNRFRERFNITLNEGYGLTETAPVTNWCRPHEWRLRSVGMSLPQIDQRIADPSGEKIMPTNAEGEVQMRGPNVMKGYYRDPDATAAVFTADGYFKTGDMGRLDEDRFLYITGRIKEMLIIGGENVFPREIEEVLNANPTVAASGVVGKADDMRGEVPIAFVEAREGETVDPKALRSWCRERLAGYKVPDEVRVVESLPRNPTGKILRRELKKLV